MGENPCGGAGIFYLILTLNYFLFLKYFKIIFKELFYNFG